MDSMNSTEWKEPKPEPATTQRSSRPPKLTALGRTLLILALLQGVLLVVRAGWTSLVALGAALVAFPVLIEIRGFAVQSRTDELAREPWGIDAISLVTAGFAVAALSQIALPIAWAVSWLSTGLLIVLGMRALVR